MQTWSLQALALKPLLPEHEVKVLKGTPVNLGQGVPDLCDWMQRVCFLRDEFRGKVLVVNLGTKKEQSYFFSFALQSPKVAAFQKLTKLIVAYPNVKDIEATDLHEMMMALDEIWPWQFALKLAPPTYGWELNEVPKMWCGCCSIALWWVTRSLRLRSLSHLTNSPKTSQHSAQGRPAARRKPRVGIMRSLQARHRALPSQLSRNCEGRRKQRRGRAAA